MPAIHAASFTFSYPPESTVVFCRECLASRSFEVDDLKTFASVWPDCCGNPVTLISGAQYLHEVHSVKVTQAANASIR
jgi:hypothetical protein